MRYWVYISDKVEGPFEEEKLVTLQGFTPDTLICSEDAASGGNQEWVKASSVFEFDRVTPEPADNAVPAQTQPAAQQPATQTDALAALLISKLDALTAQITGMQTKLDGMQAKLDGMQTKFDEAVTTARQTVQTPADIAYVPPQEEEKHNTITLTRHDLTPETNDDALITNTASLVSKAEDLVASAEKTKDPVADMLEPMDLNDAENETDLGTNGADIVLRSAMDSLYNAQTLAQNQEINESTFQDLLTPAQAKALAEQAEILKTQTAQINNTLKSTENAEKDALISQFTVQPKEDVLDQVIKEREEEKAEAIHAVDTSADNPIELPSVEEPKPAEPIAQPEQQEQPDLVTETKEESIQPLDFSEPEAVPVLTIAPDAKQPEVTEEVQPASHMPADVPQQQPNQPDQPVRTTGIPSLDDIGESAQKVEQDKKEETMQELVPGAKEEKPEDVLITAQDLKDAFTERDAHSDQTVEQLFGIDQQANQSVEAKQLPAEKQKIPSLDDISQQTTAQPLPVGNPNDLTEIELKEGSTYLISDFVPPAQTEPGALPQQLNTFTNAQTQEQSAKTNSTDAFTEILSTSTMPQPAELRSEDTPSDVTVSQVILENTIKTKRGATLDIKTVPMVPEPAQSERLQIEGLDDDINAQHDIKPADEKPAKNNKMILGILATFVLAALIYGMLAFMNVIPAQFNLLSGNKAQEQQDAAHQAQMEEMLSEEPAQPQPAQEPQQPAISPMDAALTEVQNYPLTNGLTLKEFIEAKHPAAQNLITWDISTAVDPDNYSVLVKVPPENPQSFKISYRFNYNTVTKTLDPTISDAKNLLDQANQSVGVQQRPQPAPAM